MMEHFWHLDLLSSLISNFFSKFTYFQSLGNLLLSVIVESIEHLTLLSLIASLSPPPPLCLLQPVTSETTPFHFHPAVQCLNTAPSGFNYSAALLLPVECRCQQLRPPAFVCFTFHCSVVCSLSSVLVIKYRKGLLFFVGGLSYSSPLGVCL